MRLCLSGACQDRSSNTKESNPFFSSTGDDYGPARVVITEMPAAAHRPKASAAGHALSKSSKALEGLLPRAFTKSTAASRKHKKAAQEGDDNAELAFFVPPAVKATLTRCAAQSRERAGAGRVAGAGDGRGIRDAKPAASAGSGRFRTSPATPSLTPCTIEGRTVSASSEDGGKSHFFAAANASGSEDGDAAGDGGGGGGGLAPGGIYSGNGGQRNEDASVTVCGVHAAEDGKEGGSGGVVGPRNVDEPGAPTGDEPLLGRPPGGRESMGGGGIDKLRTVLAAEGGDDKNAGPVVDERSDSPGIGCHDVRCFSTSCDEGVGGDCCANRSPGSAGGIAVATATATTDTNGDGYDQQKWQRFWAAATVDAVTRTMSISILDLEAALSCA